MGAGKGRQRRAKSASPGSNIVAEREQALRLLAASYCDTGDALPTCDPADDLFDQEYLGLNPGVKPGDGETVITVEGREVAEEALRGLNVTDRPSQESLLLALAGLQLGWDQISGENYDKLLAQGVFVELDGGIELSKPSWMLVQRLLSGEETEETLADAANESPLGTVDAERVTF